MEADADCANKTIKIKLTSNNGEAWESGEIDFFSSSLNDNIGSIYMRSPGGGAVSVDNVTIAITGDSDVTSKHPDSPISGKTVYAFGDSIVYGHNTPAQSFMRLIANDYAINLNMMAKNGATIMSSSNQILTQIKNAPSDTPDIVMFEGYTNDAYGAADENQRDVTSCYGTFDLTNFDNFDTNTFCGSFENTIKTMKDKWGENTKYVFVTIHKSGARDFEIQTKLRELTVAMCEKWDIAVVDMFKDSTLDTRDAQQMANYMIGGKGSHPNVKACEEFYIPSVVKVMESLYKNDNVGDDETPEMVKKITAEYNVDGSLKDVKIEDIEKSKVPETVVNTTTKKTFYWKALSAEGAMIPLENVKIINEPSDVSGVPRNVEVPAAATTYSSVSIIWDKPEDYKDVTGYNVYIDGKKAASTKANETYCTAENLDADKEYTFTVKSIIGNTESEASTVTAKTDKKGTVRNVMDAPYNAKGDGTTLDTASIQQAIDDCEANDIVLIPEGKTFLTGALDLKSDMTLEVNGELLGSNNAADFEKAVDTSKTYSGGTATDLVYTEEAPKRLIWSRVEGWELYSYRSLINVGYLDENTDYATDKNYVCSNVKIIGTGKLTGGSGRTTYAPIKGGATGLAIAEGNSAETFYDLEKSVTADDTIRSRIRGRLINVSNAQDIYIKGVTVANPPMWTVHMIYSDNITTNGVNFQTSGYRNGDGWDPDSSTNCTIFDCDFSTGDDCVAIKSGKNPEGNEVARPSKNIKVLGCRSKGGLGLAVGSEMSGGVEGVYVRDCDLSDTSYGIELKANKVRGGYIRDFHVQDSTIDRVLIHSVTYNADGEAADTPPVFSDITFNNTTILGYGADVRINGDVKDNNKTWRSPTIMLVGFENDINPNDDTYYINNVSFKDVIIGCEENPATGISMTDCRDISFENVRKINGHHPQYTADDATFTVDGGDIADIVPEFTNTIEAEDMNLDNFVTEANSYASNGAVVKINGSGVGMSATAKAIYKGESGTKDIGITYFDENDGDETYTLYINDTQIDTWEANVDLGSNGADERSRTNHISKNVSIATGDTVKLTVKSTTQYGSGRVDMLEIGDVGSIAQIEPIQLHEGITGSDDTDNKIYTWSIGQANTATTAGTTYSDTENDIADLTVSLGAGDSMYRSITFSDTSVKEPETNGQANVNDTKRYLLVRPKCNGTMNVAITFTSGKQNNNRVYYKDFAVGEAVDLTQCIKSATMMTGSGISANTLKTMTLPMTAGHTYVLYTYQNASAISALSYEYLDEEIEVTPDGLDKKYMHISFDDVYECLKDITDNADTYNSVFENAFLGDLKILHEKYGAVFTLNCFNKQSKVSDYDISNLPNKYASELTSNSDWLKFSFHAYDNRAQYTSGATVSGRTNRTAAQIKSEYKTFTDAIMKATNNNADSIDTVVRLGFFAGDADCVDAIRADVDYPITGLLTADDTRVSYYFSNALNSHILQHGYHYDSDKGLKLIQTQLRLESVTNTTAELEKLKTYNGNMIEIFTHEYEYTGNLPTVLEAYISWAKDNSYGFGYAMNLIKTQ